MIEEKFKIDSTIQARAELTCQYESEYSPRKCIVALEQEVNLNSIHDIMCCDHPVKSINLEEGWKLKIHFKQCMLCEKCKPNTFLNSFKSVQSMSD